MNRLWLAVMLLATVAAAGCGSKSTAESCQNGSDCASGLCFNNRCVDCIASSDCARAQRCADNKCVARARCDAGQTCQPGVCVNGLCMDCQRNTDCGAGFSCVDNVCVSGEQCEGRASCNNHGECSVVAGQIQCACDTGYSGARCENCASGFHLENGACVPDTTCQADTCNGHGQCSIQNGQPVCACDTGYAGAHCENCAGGYVRWPSGGTTCVDDPCDPYPCAVEHAVPNGCVQTGEATFVCTCESGWTWNGTICTDTCRDQDGDTYGEGPGCAGPDCNDNDPSIHPNVIEACDGVDNDCDSRTDCAGGVCQGADPCVDPLNICIQGTCNGTSCAFDPIPNPSQVSCDPDFGGPLTESDGVCTATGVCRRRDCRVCDNNDQCAGGHCVCGDETCSVKRCFASDLTCQYAAEGLNGCEARNTPAMRWGEHCKDDASLACDGHGACGVHRCTDCSFTGCPYVARHTDCGNSESCGLCAAIDQCNFAPLNTSCSVGANVGCDDRCNGSGTCVLAQGRECGTPPCDTVCNANHQCIGSNGVACGGEGSCAGQCQNGQCVFPTGACGTGQCSGTCSLGTCSSNGVDCGTCCKCSAAGVPTYDSTQNTDCPGYIAANPCSNRCSALDTCAFPGATTTCGAGPHCAGHCNGSGRCDTLGTTCCSNLNACVLTDICRGTCDAAGVCSSVGNACGTPCGTNCDHGVCGVSGLCHCNETARTDCSGCLNPGTGYVYSSNTCNNLTRTCCPDTTTEFQCCQTSLCRTGCSEF